MADAQQDQLFESTIGERLRAAREEKGLALEDIAFQTRIPIRHLQHIERGEWDALPAITYSVGFARSYANAVGLDGPAIGAEVREHLGASRAHYTAATAYYEPADPARVPPRSLALIAAVLAILIIGGYLFWRSRAVDDPTTDESPIVAADTPAAGGAPPAARPAAPAAAPATGPVVLTATEDVWLRIYEAGGGQSLYQGTLKAGESYQVPAGAQAPQIRTGRANVLKVTVGGVQVAPLGPPERTISNVSLRAADLAARGQAGGAAPPGAGPAPAAAPPLED
jgi:transcriptional regulator with XRE-family HTH domain